MAKLLGTARNTIYNWLEKGNIPLNRLEELGAIGADIQFVVTGQRRGHGIGEAAVHQAVLDAVDLLSLDKKVDAQQLAKAVTKLCAKAVQDEPPQSGTAKFVVNGNVGQNIGTAQGTSFVVNMGKEQKK